MLDDKNLNDLLAVETLLKLKSLEILLINKGIISQQEYDNLANELAEKVSNSILQEANSNENVEAVMKKAYDKN